MSQEVKEDTKINPTNVSFQELSGWIPKDKNKVLDWLQKVLDEAKKIDEKDLLEIVKEFKVLVYNNSIAKMYLGQAIHELQFTKHPILSFEHFFATINRILKKGPEWNKSDLLGCPFAVFFNHLGSTAGGASLLRHKQFNIWLKRVLNEWCLYLNTFDSTYVLNKSGWYSEKATLQWHPIEYKKTTDKFPYYKSWNDFFTRDIIRKFRPIASPKNENIIVTPNDGMEYRYAFNVKLSDKFWLKDMKYSLEDMFGGLLQSYTANFASHFVNGSIFQSYLNPYNFHRWWSPVSGTIVKLAVLEGGYFSKLLIVGNDFVGAGTASLPYLATINARGIIIIKTKHIGFVGVILVGMGEISSIIYSVYEGKTVKKGDELGYFQFGGSSVCVCFEDLAKYKKKLVYDSKFKENPKLDSSDSTGITFKVGSKLATIENC